MIKRAVIGYLIQWSSHSWYDILFLCNYAAPTAPHVFIASSTHVKLKSSLCTWYLIIACCTTVHNRENVKGSNLQYFKQKSVRCDHQEFTRAHRHGDKTWKIKCERGILKHIYSFVPHFVTRKRTECIFYHLPKPKTTEHKNCLGKSTS